MAKILKKGAYSDRTTVTSKGVHYKSGASRPTYEGTYQDVVGGKQIVYSFTKKQQAAQERAQKREVAAKKAYEAAVKKARLDAIANLKTAQLKSLDEQIFGLKAATRRVSERGLQKETYKAAQRQQLEGYRKDLAVGEGEVWYDKLQGYLKPTEQKFEVMHRRLSVRPKLLR